MIRLYQKSDLEDFLSSLNSERRIKERSLESFEELGILSIGKVNIEFLSGNPVLHLMTEVSEYVKDWRSSAAGNIGKDFKRNEVASRYKIFAWQSKANKCLMKMLVREFTEFQDKMSDEELKNLDEWIFKSDSLDFDLNGRWYSIIKIIKGDETWNSKQIINSDISSLSDLSQEYQYIEIELRDTFQEKPLF